MELTNHLLRPGLEGFTRAQLLQLLAASADGTYGAGVLNPRLYRAVRAEIAGLEEGRLTVARYRAVLSYLGRAAGWVAHALEQYGSGELIRPRARFTGEASPA